MHSHDLSAWTHSHAFDAGNRAAERGTRLVMAITAATMVVEIAAGLWFNSMALLADGWHMSSHALAIGLSAFAYAAARRYAGDRRFAFGTWKIEVLAGFASAVFLLGIAALMAAGSVERLLSPQDIHYREAMAVTALGLLVNLGCALILGGHAHGHDHGHDHGHHHHGHDHDHGHSHHHDINLRAAYMHVLADAATSVLALVALAGGWWLGWAWLDPVMGLVGAALVGRWAVCLLRQSGAVLLDREMDHPVVEEVREVLAGLDPADANGEERTSVTDLHVWRVGRQQFACIACLVTHDPALTPQRVREALSVHEELVHVTVEISRCEGAH
ncbi:CDF family Co(II)/Ni(II) efflux transporter DmeF [Cupriavidus necator]|uniref:Cation transporter n=1 Tax=Cupriavidus necator (strain ATCC 17699 / DSM 428 / KCTC 22496 / NCIMB 10442 / H16 / Stanier 337) TaxID=381666 RepID=Q0KF00_CUPNH|nr:CDF family Co(II)/Ni(II) efflux transporter DmeF [Cupriavidus necator]QCB99376.1 cation transporter [Cupriavidus necator H16]QQB77807.1 CDF family Co(II)/Ni(II) efflux transporter DmeF [Cupriavidus necator]WKA41206.1 CDF family Co(II)/Ni(II) efflux transporter DmeF [Cupriavidus necator]CAJ91421.1 Co/Zn/Cd efflux system component [Cupriavidus necator H16]